MLFMPMQFILSVMLVQIKGQRRCVLKSYLYFMSTNNN